MLLGRCRLLPVPRLGGGAESATVSNNNHPAQAVEPHRVLPGDGGLNSGSGPAAGGSFRLSFLESDTVLEGTCGLLARRGFPPETVEIFRRLVRGHNRHGNRVDRTRFPESQAGWYEFRDLDDLTRRLVCPLSQTPAASSSSVHAQVPVLGLFLAIIVTPHTICIVVNFVGALLVFAPCAILSPGRWCTSQNRYVSTNTISLGTVANGAVNLSAAGLPERLPY